MGRVIFLVLAMAASIGLMSIITPSAFGDDDAPPADLSKPRLTVPTAREGQIQNAERKAVDELLRNRAEIIVIEGMPGLDPPPGAKPADLNLSAWTRPSQLRPWLRKAGVRPLEVDQVTVKVVVGHDDWRLNEEDIHRAVSASVAARAEGKPAPRIEYQYPKELAPLQKAYEEAVRGGNTNIEGTSERLLLIELPRRRRR